jgi:hypothetical protein
MEGSMRTRSFSFLDTTTGFNSNSSTDISSIQGWKNPFFSGGPKLTVDGFNNYRREFADSLLMFKILNGYCTVNRTYWAELNARQNMVTRAAAEHLQLRKPLARTEKRKNFYTVRICDLWNKLPINVRAAKSVRQFKLNYRKHKLSTRRGPGDQQDWHFCPLMWGQQNLCANLSLITGNISWAHVEGQETSRTDFSGVPWTRIHSRPHNDPLGRRGLLYKYSQVSKPSRFLIQPLGSTATVSVQNR